MTVNLVALFPSHLDLNGDQANLKVARKRLEWLGHEVTVIGVEKGQELPDNAHLVFLGHGSIAAWNDLEEPLRNLVPQLRSYVDQGGAFMAVASGYERAIQLGIFDGTTEPTNRVSKFEIQELEGQEVLGYLNAATNAPVIQKKGLLLGTQLHGPFFAKNPEFTDRYLTQILNAESEPIPVGNFDKDAANENVGRVADIVKAVWELERDLASE